MLNGESREMIGAITLLSLMAIYLCVAIALEKKWDKDQKQRKKLGIKDKQQ